MPLPSLSVGNNDRMCKYGEREKCSNVFADSRKRRNWPLASEVENILTHAEQRTVHGVLVDYQCKSNSRQMYFVCNVIPLFTFHSSILHQPSSDHTKGCTSAGGVIHQLNLTRL